jgi:hypothetical protein
MVDFALVRDTMYRYSKKAEEKFFGSSCMAYFFYQFAKGKHGKEYIGSKLSRNTQVAENNVKNTSTVTFGGNDVQMTASEPQIDSKKKDSLLKNASAVASGSKLGQPRQGQNIDAKEQLERQNVLNERIVQEIDMMSEEALQFLHESFERDIKDLVHKHKISILQQEPLYRFTFIKEMAKQQILAYSLLRNLKVNLNGIINDRLASISHGTPNSDKPLLDAILANIQ